MKHTHFVLLNIDSTVEQILSETIMEALCTTEPTALAAHPQAKQGKVRPPPPPRNLNVIGGWDTEPFKKHNISVIQAS